MLFVAITITLAGFILMLWLQCNPSVGILITVSIFVLLGLVKPNEFLFKGVPEIIVIIVSLFIVIEAVKNSILVKISSDKLIRHRNQKQLLLLTTSISGLLSGFINNTPIVMMATSVLRDLSRFRTINLRMLLLPISFASILGGTLTIVGSTTNIIIFQFLSEHTDDGSKLSFFAPMLVGGPVFFIGLVYLYVFAPKILDNNGSLLDIPKVIKSSMRGLAEDGWQDRLKSRLVFKSVSERVKTVRLNRINFGIISAKIMGRPEIQSFRGKFNAIWPLIVFAIFILSTAFHLLSLFQAACFSALLICLSGCLSIKKLVTAIDYNVLITVMGSFGIARAWLNSGVIDKLHDLILFLVHGEEILNLRILVLVFVVMSMILTEIMSNASAAVVMGTVALEFSRLYGISPTPILMATLFGVSSNFLTPIGYQTNMIVYQAGGYGFKDFFNIGLGLSLIVIVGCVLLIPLFWSM